RFRGSDIVGLAPNQVTKLGIARTFQTVHLFPNMTILENAMVGQHCRTRAGGVGSVLWLPAPPRGGGGSSARGRARRAGLGPSAARDPARGGADPRASPERSGVLRFPPGRLPRGPAGLRAVL